MKIRPAESKKIDYLDVCGGHGKSDEARELLSPYEMGRGSWIPPIAVDSNNSIPVEQEEWK